MHARDYSVIALTLLNSEKSHYVDSGYSDGWKDGVETARIYIADAIAAHDPTFDREDFLKQTRGE